MSTMLDEQILQLSHKNFKNEFWAALKGGTEEDKKAADAWLDTHQGSLEKSFVEIENAVKAYLAFDPKLPHNSADPQVLTRAEKVEKNIAVIDASLTHMLQNVKWPNSSKAKGALQNELTFIKNACKKIEMLYRTKGGTFETIAVGGEGKTMASRQVPVASKDHTGNDSTTIAQNYMKAKTLLKEYEITRAAAVAAKVTYTNAKLAAKSRLTEYEEFLKKTNPEYHLRTIDWTDEKSWEKVSADPALLSALDHLHNEMAG